MHNAMRRSLLRFLILFGWFTFSIRAVAQVPPTDTNLDTGIKPYETFDRAQENVNIGSGNLNIQIPVLHLPGRNGHDFDVTLTYNSQNWTPVASPSQYYNNGTGNIPQPTPVDIQWTYGQAGVNSIGSTGWQFNLPMLYATGVTMPPACASTAQGCLYNTTYSQSSSWTGFYLVMGDGRKYSFPHASFYNWQSTTNNYPAPYYSCLPVSGSDILIDYDYPANGSPTGYQPGGGGGEGVMLDLTNAANGTGTAVVRFRDGSQMLFPMTLANTTCPNHSDGPATATGNLEIGPSAVVDPNGNVIFGGSCTVPGTSVSGTEDSVGRCISLGGGGVTYNNSNGTPETVTLTVPQWSVQNPTYPYFCLPYSNSSNLSNNCGSDNPGNYSDSGIAWVAPPQAITSMLSSVHLPDGLAYTFAYNEWGEITEITYPTGGYTRYVYQPTVMNNYIWTSEGGSADLDGTADNRMVVKKFTCSNPTPGTAAPSGYIPSSTYPDGTPGPRCSAVPGESVTSYNRPWLQPIQVVDPLGNETDYTFTGNPGAYWPQYPPTFINYSFGGPGGPEATRNVYQGSGGSKILLRTVQSQYSQSNLKTSETTTIPNVGSSQTVWAYDTTHNVVPFPAYTDEGTQETGITIIVETDNVLDKYECAFGFTGTCGQGNSALARWTQYSYLGTNSVNGINYQAPPIYNVNRLLQQTVYSGSGSQAGQTTYTYDSYSSGLSPGSTVQHGTALNPYYLSYTTRGNVTSSSDWAGAGQSNAITQYQYDTSGNVLLKTDPLGHSTQYSYLDTWGNSTCAPSGGAGTFALPTSITNAAGQATHYTWNSCSGTMASVTDPNNQTTTFGYDLMDRRTQVTYPDGGQTTLQYSDPTLPISITETKAISTNSNNVSTTILDGLSRPWETQQSDPEGADTVVTIYDAVGNVECVTNPFRGADSASTPVTCFGYDALRRKVIQTQQDNASTLQWCYDNLFSNAGYDFGSIKSLDGVTHNVSDSQNSSLCSSHIGTQAGDWVDSLDEDGNHWQRTSDAFGRLVEVMEPSGSNRTPPSLETDYTYNLLDTMINVNQRGNGTTDAARSRSFTYDGLSRLLCSSNPENSSAICPATYSSYVTGTTGYSYDANGNVLTKTDARGITTNYGYDSINRLVSKGYSSNAPAGSLSSCYAFDTAANGVGRLGFEWTQAASCPSSGQATPPSSGYQSLRVLGAYDAMGRIVSEQQCILGYCTSPSPPVTPQPNCTTLQAANGLTYCYDLAGDLTAYSGGLNSGVFSQQNIMFSQGFDSVGRLLSVNSSLNSSQLPPNLFTVNPTQGYTPFGAVQNWAVGSKVDASKGYDNRMRVTSENVTQQ